MHKRKHLRVSDLHGIHRLASDATVGITDLVEAMHHTILRTPGILGKSPAGRTRGITGFVYRSVRGVTRLVGGGLDVLLERFASLIRDEHTSPEREAVLAALNGVLGDYLVASGNPLALPMRLYANGVPLEISRDALAAAVPQPGGHLLVLVHGLCRNHLQWTRDGHDHGAALARDLGCTPVYLHYNSGRHISENGREFADLMQALVREWPHPIERLSMLGHSMGGLVARSACHYGALANHTWVARLDRLVFLGSPHFGSPLERAGTRADFLIETSPVHRTVRATRQGAQRRRPRPRPRLPARRGLAGGAREEARRARCSAAASRRSLSCDGSEPAAATRQGRREDARRRTGTGRQCAGPQPRCRARPRLAGRSNAGSVTGWDISTCSTARTRTRAFAAGSTTIARPGSAPDRCRSTPRPQADGDCGAWTSRATQASA